MKRLAEIEKDISQLRRKIERSYKAMEDGDTRGVLVTSQIEELLEKIENLEQTHAQVMRELERAGY